MNNTFLDIEIRHHRRMMNMNRRFYHSFTEYAKTYKFTAPKRLAKRSATNSYNEMCKHARKLADLLGY